MLIQSTPRGEEKLKASKRLHQRRRSHGRSLSDALARVTEHSELKLAAIEMV